MKIKNIILLSLTALLSLSLVSCKKYDTFKDYSGELKKYSNKVTLSEFEKLNNLIEENYNNNLGKEFETIGNIYENKVTTKNPGEKTEIKYTNTTYSTLELLADYDKQIISIKESALKTNSTKSVNNNGESKTEEKEEYGYQEVDGSFALVDKLDKEVMKMSDDWTTIVSEIYPHNDFKIHLLLPTFEFYIDNNVYTIVYESNSDESNYISNIKTTKQYVIEDNSLSYLELNEIETTGKEELKETIYTSKCEFIRFNVKNVKLKPINTKDFKVLKEGELPW